MSLSPRPRLTTLVERSTRRGVCVIVATAGYGKTEAVRDALGERAHYLAVDRQGNGVEDLARLVIAGVVPRRASGLAALLQQPQTGESDQHLATWVAAQLRSVDEPIVLDDFHHVADDPHSIGFVRHVIEHTAPRVVWVIVSREEPRLPLASWLGRGWMEMPIVQEDLEFDEAEAAELAAASRSTIDPGSLVELLRDTRGWPIAMRLGLSAWERTQALPPMRLRARDLLFRFVHDEVWTRLGDEDRELLTACALLSQPRLDVLEAATFADATARMRSLHARVPLLQRFGTDEFRLHELFRDFITESIRSDPVRRDALIARVAEALRRVADEASALKLFVEARRDREIVAVLREHGFALLDQGQRTLVHAALTAVTAQIPAVPELFGLRAYAHGIDGAWEIAETQMARALQLGASGTSAVELQRRLARILTNRGRAADAVGLLEAATRAVPAESERFIEIRAALAGSYAVAGRSAEAAAVIEETESAAKLLEPASQVRVEQLLAFAAFFIEAFGDAERLASSAASGAAALGLDRVAAMSYGVLIALTDATNPSPGAVLAYIRQMQRFASNVGDRILLAQAVRARFVNTAQAGDDAGFAEAEAELARLGRIAAFRGPIPERLARLLYDAGHGRFATAITAWNAIDARGLNETERALHASVLALLHAACGDEDAADRYLRKPLLATVEGDLYERRYFSYAVAYRALALWLLHRATLAKRMLRFDGSGLVERDIIYINAITSICRIARRTVTQSQLVQLTEPLAAFGCDGYLRFLRRICDAPETAMTLTPTELDILAALREGGTAAEVAERLGRRKSTVDWHLKSIYRKIGCHGRTEAVAYAEQMGWLR